MALMALLARGVFPSASLACATRRNQKKVSIYLSWERRTGADGPRANSATSANRSGPIRTGMVLAPGEAGDTVEFE